MSGGATLSLSLPASSHASYMASELYYLGFLQLWRWWSTASCGICWSYAGPDIDCRAQHEKKGCAACEALHGKEWKHMPQMCCIDWCSIQGPSQPSPGLLCRFHCQHLLMPPTWPPSSTTLVFCNFGGGGALLHVAFVGAMLALT